MKIILDKNINEGEVVMEAMLDFYKNIRNGEEINSLESYLDNLGDFHLIKTSFIQREDIKGSLKYLRMIGKISGPQYKSMQKISLEDFSRYIHNQKLEKTLYKVVDGRKDNKILIAFGYINIYFRCYHNTLVSMGVERPEIDFKSIEISYKFNSVEIVFRYNSVQDPEYEYEEALSYSEFRFFDVFLKNTIKKVKNGTFVNKFAPATEDKEKLMRYELYLELKNEFDNGTEK